MSGFGRFFVVGFGFELACAIFLAGTFAVGAFAVGAFAVVIFLGAAFEAALGLMTGFYLTNQILSYC